jgi:hypothetical protein
MQAAASGWRHLTPDNGAALSVRFCWQADFFRQLTRGEIAPVLTGRRSYSPLFAGEFPPCRTWLGWRYGRAADCRVGAGARGELTMEIHGAIAILTVVTAVIAAWLA